MHKRISGKKLSRTTNERKQLFRNLVRSVAATGYVETSLAKAKAVQPILEKLVTRAKENSLISMRELISQTGDIVSASELKEAGMLFAKRSGGYTRLVRLGVRSGDNSDRVRLEWVEKITKAEDITLKEKVQKDKGNQKVKTVQKDAEKLSVKKEKVK